jgi:hypothetical protein
VEELRELQEAILQLNLIRILKRKCCGAPEPQGGNFAIKFYKDFARKMAWSFGSSEKQFCN